MEKKWYFSTWFLMLLSAFSVTLVPGSYSKKFGKQDLSVK